MSRIVVVSNRVFDSSQASRAGGVAVALADFLNQRGGLWFGWSGLVAEETDAGATIRCNEFGVVNATLSLTPSEHREYYLGYANSVLWPVFHNRVDLAHFEAGYFSAYSSVNRRFAQTLKSILLPDDIIWVHDYHFLPFARELRGLGVRNPIGFFLHIPFPPAQSFLAVPEYVELASSACKLRPTWRNSWMPSGVA